jgi:putative restriction endonuclease
MRYFIAVTDNSWFRFHVEHKPDEVNFWRPGGESGFSALEEGAPFLFKLHSPESFIAGGGFYVSYTKLPVSMAWRVFEGENGFAGLASFRKTIFEYKGEPNTPGVDPVIGCIILAIPFFFPRDMWLPAPRDWHPNIVQGKTYDTQLGIGKEIWDQVLQRLGHLPGYLDLDAEIRKKGPLYVVEGRLGQGAFRSSVLEAYNRRCAITQERTMPALEASHIKPYKESGPNKVSNGLLLRADLHQIFDEGYITITSDLKIEVSKKIKQEFENGKEYYQFHGHQLLNLPVNPLNRPSAAYIEWHNQYVYRG